MYVYICHPNKTTPEQIKFFLRYTVEYYFYQKNNSLASVTHRLLCEVPKFHTNTLKNQ